MNLYHAEVYRGEADRKSATTFLNSLMVFQGQITFTVQLLFFRYFHRRSVRVTYDSLYVSNENHLLVAPIAKAIIHLVGLSLLA